VHSTSIPSPQDPAFALRKRKTLVGNLVLSMGSVLIMLALAEGISSLMIPAPITWRDPQEIYNHDPLLGHALAPGQNSFTHSIPQAGTVRILCLGDSLTFGDGVAVEDTYPKQLETMLNVMGKHQYEVINTGVPSYDTWQEVTFFKTKGVQFEPRIVVLGFYGNDIVPRPAVIKTSLSGEGTLRRKGFGGFLPDGMVHLLKGSRFLLLLKDRVGKLVDSTKPSSEHLHQQALLDGLPDEFVEQGWQEVEASLLQMVELQKTREFRFLIVTFPMAEQLMREHPQAQYQARLKSIADKLDIPFIDLKPVFQREFRDFGSLFIEWDGHPNPKAHRLAAEEIARVLGSMIKTE
jgi:lysophospholipase L1-like esterase